MTRIFTEGAEFQDMSFWSAFSAGGSVSTSVKRSGNASYYVSGNNTFLRKNIPSLTEFYLRFGFYSDMNMTSWFLQANNGDTVLDGLLINNTTKLIHAYVSGTSVATSTRTISASVWNLIEVYFKLADSGGRIVVYLNGMKEIDYTGDTKPDTNTVYNVLNFNGWNGGWANIDDIALNDTDNSDGKNDNSWCGDGHVELLTPNAEGDVLQWYTSSGSTHYLLVDEYPYDSDTTYIYASGTAGKQDMFNLTSYTDTNKSVSRIFVEARAKDFSISANVAKFGIKTGGNVYLNSGIALPGVYTIVKGYDYFVNPVGSGLWTKADLDALQIVVESV